jgi:NAD(P)-dependent dehydrogenase (short-subunit alcohol dehydrogenase family)
MAVSSDFFQILILLHLKIRTRKKIQHEEIIIITGASSGFGALTARALAKAGHTVYASMRETKGRNAPQVEEAKKFAKDNDVDLRAIELDVSSQESCDAAIQEIIAKNGRLDVVIHNAGHMVFGPAEAFTPEQLAELYDVNVLSTQRVNRAALPQLRKQGKGSRSLGVEQQLRGRNATLSGAVLRGEGRHGCIGRGLRA